MQADSIKSKIEPYLHMGNFAFYKGRNLQNPICKALAEQMVVIAVCTILPENSYLRRARKVATKLPIDEPYRFSGEQDILGAQIPMS